MTRHRSELEAAAAREQKLLNDVARLSSQVAVLDDENRALQKRVKAAERTAAAAAQEPLRAPVDTAELVQLRARLAEAEAARDVALRDRAAPDDADLRRIREALVSALAAVDRSDAQRTGRPTRSTRTPLGLPGGIVAESDEGAEFLLRAPGVVVLVDGYNVAKLAWPNRALDQQRDACVAAAERLATRWGTFIHVVFDGAAVVGGHTSARRLVRVSYSPAGVLADDVLRTEVRLVPADRPVVVVTNDRAIITDVRAEGANVLSSDAFAAVARA